MKTPRWFMSFNIIAILLLPIAVIYYIISKIVFISRLFHRFRSKTPVICVGGVLAGGVGKTPIVREIAKYLNATVVMRGYKGKKVGGQVKSSDSAYEVGDEAKMLAEDGISVYTGDRKESLEAINYLDSRSAAIVMDDGFQNPSIKKDLSLLVFDEDVGVGNGMLIPAGPMRETLMDGISRADAIIINGGPIHKVMKVAKSCKKPVFFAKKEMDTSGFFGKYVAFCGIGYPNKFFDALRNVISIRIVEKVSFSDHHIYTKDDIIKLFKMARMYEARLVCTEKDWIKLPKNIQAKVRFVPLKTTVQANFWLWLEKKISKDS